MTNSIDLGGRPVVNLEGPFRRCRALTKPGAVFDISGGRATY